MFAETPVKFDRIALNMDQINHYKPPPNPAKITDSRAASYMSKYGDESWELDALNPQDMIELIRSAVLEVTDPDIWEVDVQTESNVISKLQEVAKTWEDSI